MSIKRAGYWFLTGALIGFGSIAILSIGFLFIIVGIVLVVIGLNRMRGQERWTAVVGFGGVPALILLRDVTSAPWACTSPAGGALPNVNYYTCVDTFVGQLTSYHILAFWFGIITLLGIVWPLARYFVRRSWRTAA